MSFLDQLNQQKTKLKKNTETIVRYADGSRVLVVGDKEVPHSSQLYGFVVDTKPDRIPASIIDGKLFLGSQDACDDSILSEYQFSDILSVGIPTPGFDLENVKSRFVECLDLPETNLKEVFKPAFDYLDECLANGTGRRVLVHCNAGVSRSASIVIGYLIVRMGLSFDEAFSLVKSRRECIQPNAGFLKQLKLL